MRAGPAARECCPHCLSRAFLAFAIPTNAFSRASTPPLTPLLSPSVNTNGSITQDEEAGEVIQLQGDQRQNAREWLLAQEVVPANEVDRIVIRKFEGVQRGTTHATNYTAPSYA